MRYVAVLVSEAVRDVQICSSAEHDHGNDATWSDYYGAELFLGIFKGIEREVRQEAADKVGTAPENIHLIEMD